MEKYGKARQATDRNSKIRPMRIARWTTTTTVTHSEYLTLFSLPLEQRLHERASMLRYTYITSPVSTCSVSSQCYAIHTLRLLLAPVLSALNVTLYIHYVSC